MVQIAIPFYPFNAFHPWTLTLNTIAFCMILLAGLWFTRRKLRVQEIPGPVDDASWLYGNLPELLLTQPYGKFEFQWQEKYGPVYRFKGCFSEDLLFISDPAAVRYILNDAKSFDFSPNRAFMVSMIFGKDALPALHNGGEAHRRIKNAFSPAFALARLQSCNDLKAVDRLMEQYLERKLSDSNATVDIYHLLQHVTSDIIGEVGFGQKFNAVETNGGDKVVQSHQNVLLLGSRDSKSAILGESIVSHLPRIVLSSMLYLPTPTVRTLHDFRTISEEWAGALLRTCDSTDAGLVGLVGMCIPDYLRLSSPPDFFLANKNKNKELSFDEISQQASSIVVAGQDTTANALVWAIYELAKWPEWQDKVRKEVMEAQGAGTGSDKLEYLNAHIKETLRFHSSVPITERVAFNDTVLPLSRTITTSSGRVITQLPIRKGQMIYVGLASYNRNPHIWGPNASTFDPFRWIDGRYSSESLPGSIGPYSNLASFAGGARICLGWRLALLEMQLVLSEFVSKFRFSFAPGQQNNVVSRFALTLLPVDVESGKPSLSVLVQPIQAHEG
ncbi:hypothetical protein E1B28_002152 [Marasmius oreades]|uniref:Cytochrome P450 n=1 Tax=Marasmius oreades TaxID=181124 RepID=A0A9P7RM47_9AGAR|nr:uncharacterized protein E1B28_002152 [Marasmius oreades]KAG7086189.1 hypothetical protein E1B28_002152 [Marasmius oreades]